MTDADTAGFRWPVRVYHEDTDHGGIVFHASYLKFMERARTEWLRALGIDQVKLREDTGLMFIVVRVCIDYLRPARFDDCLEVGVEPIKVGRASLTLAQPVLHTRGKLLCRAEVRVAAVDDRTLRPAPIPEHLRVELTH